MFLSFFRRIKKRAGICPRVNTITRSRSDAYCPMSLTRRTVVKKQGWRFQRVARTRDEETRERNGGESGGGRGVGEGWPRRGGGEGVGVGGRNGIAETIAAEREEAVVCVAFGRRKLGKIMKEVDTKEWEALVPIYLPIPVTK